MLKKSPRWHSEHLTHSPEETQSLSELIAKQLDDGTLLVLTGDLGAGKTTFVKGIAQALGIDPTEVISPTFVLIREHRGGDRTLIHADAYRSETPQEFLEIGLAEYLASEAIVIIEWGEKLAEILPEDAIVIEFEMLKGDERRISITAPQPLQL